MKIQLSELEERSQGSAAEQRESRAAMDDEPTHMSHGTIHGERVSSVPQDFRRTDEELRNDVIERIQGKSGAMSGSFQVHVRDGVLSIKGQTANAESKKELEDAVRGVLGIVQVEAEIDILGDGTDG